MGLSDWRAKHNMRDPVRGVFRVTGFYDKHPSSSPPGTRITGVITAPGIPATPAEHKVDERGRWADHQELPVLVDRSDPSRFAILWNEVGQVSWRGREMASAQAEADRLNSGQPGYPPYAGQPAVQAAAGQALRAAGMTPGAEVLGAPGRPMPGMPGGGLTPEQAAQMIAGESGERASAVVLDAREIVVPPGMPSAPAGTVDITLEVRRADGTRYTTVTRVGFSTPERRARVATPGTQLTVRIDPGDRSGVAIDTAGLFGGLPQSRSEGRVEPAAFP
jgi:hypothetical protein